jgi:hypothetical protein
MGIWLFFFGGWLFCISLWLRVARAAAPIDFSSSGLDWLEAPDPPERRIAKPFSQWSHELRWNLIQVFSTCGGCTLDLF